MTNDIDNKCRNPWKPKCGSENIKLYIVINKEQIPICHRCWDSIATTDLEWGEN